jgi:L-fuconolactonase
MTRRRATSAETLFSIRDSSSLSQDEKIWILGATARRILKWPTAGS